MWQPQGFYNEYILRTPVILSGENAIRGLYNYPAARIAVIHGKSFKDKELFETVFPKKELHFISRSWNGEPDLAELKGTISELEKYQPDTIIAVGGGSVIDGSKICRLLYECPYYKTETTRIDSDTLKTHFIAVPTTIGSGAEVSSAAVFIDNTNHRKDMIVIQELLPDVVVYDENYVKEVPTEFLCVSALDAMAHILEGYVSNVNNALAEIMAEEGFLLLFHELNKIINDKVEAVDYQRLQYAGFLGGMVQNHCIVGAAHAIAHQLTEYKYSHSEAIALILPAVIKMNAADLQTEEKYMKLGALVGITKIEQLSEFVSAVCNYAGISEKKTYFKELLNKLSANVLFLENVKKDRGGKGNPIEITDDYIKELIRSI